MTVPVVVESEVAVRFFVAHSQCFCPETSAGVPGTAESVQCRLALR